MNTTEPWPPPVTYDIPIPEPYNRHKRSSRTWGFLRTVGVGGSFPVYNRAQQTDGIQAAQKFGMEMRSRKTNTGARLWRVK